MKILIAEDDPTIRNNLGRTLRLEGYEPIVAENGRHALQLLAQCTPALILSDVMMPELDGHGLLQAIRAQPQYSQIPFVFLTARADRSDVREGMKLGADDYLTKPFQREELLDLVRTQLARAEQRQAAHSRLQQDAERLRSRDAVTDLPNRQGFLDLLERSLRQAERDGGELVVATLNIGGLNEIRQTRNADTANTALRALADRLFSACNAAQNSAPQLARIDGERFALLLEAGDAESLLDAQLRPLLTLARRIEFGQETLHCMPSMGIARFPTDAQSAEDLLQRAEAAEPAPSAEGELAFHCDESNRQLSRRVQLLQALHSALHNQQLQLAFQPQVQTVGEQVVGFEALLRWQHPEFGFVSPAEFIPLAEDSGLIVPIGAWVLETACRQAKDWLDAGFGPLRIAVNLSARQFADDDLPARVAGALQQSGLPAKALELEITESVAMLSAERTLAILRTLKGLGLHLAMDDFGTGYSSLAYLKRYPLDVLKIDQLFIRGLIDDVGDAAITRAVIAMAHSLGLQVIAEGVETEAHVQKLAELGCDLCQGYHFARPLPAEAATDWLIQRREALADAGLASG